MSFNFMAVVTICSDFGAQENKVCHCFHFPPSICHEVMGLDAKVWSMRLANKLICEGEQRKWSGIIAISLV